MVYEVQVYGETTTNGTTATDNFTGDWWSPTYTSPYTSNTYWYTYPATIYMYQITCPRCKTMNWMQLDTITDCKGFYRRDGTPCGAKLKAVTNQADYEIPVNI